MKKARIGTTEKIQVGITELGVAGISTPKTSLQQAGHKIVAAAVQTEATAIAFAIDWARETADDAVNYTRTNLQLAGIQIRQVVAIDGFNLISGVGNLEQASGIAGQVIRGFMRLFGQMAGIATPQTGEMFFDHVGNPLDVIDALVSTSLDGQFTSLRAQGFQTATYNQLLQKLVATRTGERGYYVMTLETARKGNFGVDAWKRTNDLDAEPLAFACRTSAQNVSAMPILTRLEDGSIGCDTIDAREIAQGRVVSIADAATRRTTVKQPIQVLGQTQNARQTVLTTAEELCFVPEGSMTAAIKHVQAAAA